MPLGYKENLIVGAENRKGQGNDPWGAALWMWQLVAYISKRTLRIISVPPFLPVWITHLNNQCITVFPIFLRLVCCRQVGTCTLNKLAWKEVETVLGWEPRGRFHFWPYSPATGWPQVCIWLLQPPFLRLHYGGTWLDQPLYRMWCSRQDRLGRKKADSLLFS